MTASTSSAVELVEVGPRDGFQAIDPFIPTVRMMLYEAAQVMLLLSAKWSWLKAWAMKIARHRGLNKTIVALARRLAVIMHRIWVDGTEFRWTREVAVGPSRIKYDRRNSSATLRRLQ
jgi:hypothetical protein